MSFKTIPFGKHAVHVPGFGAMGLSAFYGATNIETAKETLRKAIEIGCTLWNTADMYGNGANEELIGSVLAEGDNRSKVFVITKFGQRWGEGIDGYKCDGSASYTTAAIDASIKRLGFAPDAWALHRIDKTVTIEETVKAMDDARTAGKTTYIGLSECSAATLRKATNIAKIDFIEVEYSPWELTMETNGVLAAAKQLGIIVLAYSPLGRGFLTGRYKRPEDFIDSTAFDFRSMLPRMQAEVWEQNYKIVTEFETLAAKKGCTAGQLSLAWLMAQGDNIVPIPGTKSSKYLVENFAASSIVLTSAELAEIRAVVEANVPVGDRYMAKNMAALDSF